MNQSEDCVMQGQISIFEILDHDTWSGKMSQERSVPTKERISELSSKKQRGSQTVMPLFLDLRTDTSGHTQGAYWQMGGALLGDYMTHSFGECPKDAKESRLSQILEDNPHPKYCLSEKACQGILNRAEKRGKKLPEQLETALREQVTRLKSGGGREFDSYGKRAGKGALIQKEKSATLGVSQDQTLIQTAWDGSQVSPTLTANNANGGQRMPDKDNFNAVITYGVDKHNMAVNEEKTQTLIQGEKNKDVPVVIGIDGYNQVSTGDKAKTLNAIKSDSDHVPCVAYGLDRASFNQGKNAQFDFCVDEEVSPPIVSRGPGGVLKTQ